MKQSENFKVLNFSWISVCFLIFPNSESLQTIFAFPFSPPEKRLPKCRLFPVHLASVPGYHSPPQFLALSPLRFTPKRRHTATSYATSPRHRPPIVHARQHHASCSATTSPCSRRTTLAAPGRASTRACASETTLPPRRCRVATSPCSTPFTPEPPPRHHALLPVAAAIAYAGYKRASSSRNTHQPHSLNTANLSFLL